MPITNEGSLMADRTLASCYASVDHDLSHFAVASLYWYPDLTDLIFGEDNKYQVSVSSTLPFLKWILPYAQSWRY